jgi:hypothetical protein
MNRLYKIDERTYIPEDVQSGIYGHRPVKEIDGYKIKMGRYGIPKC